MKTRKFDDEYINHCISDLKKWKGILKSEDNIDCIIDALKDYKEKLADPIKEFKRTL